ncbi:class I SAM-dependent methyltransferase [Rhodocytophaga rosea]|uniref:Class I SAM-dependent methyltransferase n=1 Tax=Rhodocytophaga rosea TaxID=2704465 RepID=A0A6C0GE04_9BACT|nr:class I SAM-dependent methyltransferase [Rhodocytophaga rosea]QHT66201.1 class I SAM-dependent methyltransferase [Rhodocytophaga rosea]
MREVLQTKDMYFMDDPREGDRLYRKANAKVFVAKYLESHLENLTNARILEAGCGSGAFLQVLGQTYVNHSFVGIDISGERVREANARVIGQTHVKAMQASIYQLPFPDNYFDFIYCRFLYEYLQQPIEATKELFRVCKPEGKLLVQDLDGQFTMYPETPAALKKVILLLKNETGFDPDVGRKLFTFGKSASFSCVHAEIEAYHKKFGSFDEENYRLWELKVDIALEYVKKVLPDAKWTENFKNEFLASLRDENTVLFSNLFTLTFEKAYMHSS